jgi:anti-sigma factor ChrR (cupin superfamily)
LFSDASLLARQWETFRKGIEIHWIYKTPGGASAALLKYAPGARLGRHIHAGYEHIFVLRGSQTDENGQHERGTLLIHGPGTTHSIHSDPGCIVLAVWEKSVHIFPDQATAE